MWDVLSPESGDEAHTYNICKQRYIVVNIRKVIKHDGTASDKSERFMAQQNQHLGSELHIGPLK